MWFDVQAALAETEGSEKSHSNLSPRATCATTATQDPGDLFMSHKSHMSHAPHDLETAGSGPWGADDLQGYFNERAGIAEFDGGQSRREAEAQAFECCVSEWLCQHPQASEPGSCAHCGRGDLAGRDVLPYGDAIHGATHLHSECWGQWYAKRRQSAVAALKALGIQEGGQSR